MVVDQNIKAFNRINVCARLDTGIASCNNCTAFAFSTLMGILIGMPRRCGLLLPSNRWVSVIVHTAKQVVKATVLNQSARDC